MFWSKRPPTLLSLLFILVVGVTGIVYPFKSTNRTPPQVKAVMNQTQKSLALFLSGVHIKGTPNNIAHLQADIATSTTASSSSSASFQQQSPNGWTVLPTPHYTGQQGYYEQQAWNDAVAAGISPYVFIRQINQESGFQTGPSVTSSTGAQGIAQFEPYTASGLGIDPNNPEQALQGAAQLDSRYVSKYGGIAEALAAYNGGSGTLESAKVNCGANWISLSCLPSQTYWYIHTILDY